MVVTDVKALAKSVMRQLANDLNSDDEAVRQEALCMRAGLYANNVNEEPVDEGELVVEHSANWDPSTYLPDGLEEVLPCRWS